jgi:hypothetical protein
MFLVAYIIIWLHEGEKLREITITYSFNRNLFLR